MQDPVAPLDEATISQLIVENFAQDFVAGLRLDVAIVGAGPSGLTAARLLARDGLKVAVFERHLYVGGGMWGGGMLFPRIVVQEEARELLDEVGVSLEKWKPGYLVADAVEAVAKCSAAAIDAGAKIWVGISVEDVIIRPANDQGDKGYRIGGVVVNWRAVELAGMHVDPLGILAHAVIDATGHDAEVCRTVVRKIPGARLNTPTGQVPGENSMWAEMGEKVLVENTVEVYPGLVVAGMAANAVTASPRMGAVFGGMFLSGQKAAQLAKQIVDRTKGSSEIQ